MRIWQKNENGDIFWDTYVHPECKAIFWENKHFEDLIKKLSAIFAIADHEAAPRGYRINIGEYKDKAREIILKVKAKNIHLV